MIHCATHPLRVSEYTRVSEETLRSILVKDVFQLRSLPLNLRHRVTKKMRAPTSKDF